MRFSVCVEALWPKVSCQEAILRAADCGAKAVEFWQWWNKDIPAVKEVCAQTGVQVAGFCTKFHSLVDPSQHDAFLAGLKETLAVARELHCMNLIGQVGAAMPGVPREAQQSNLVTGLQKAAVLMAGQDARLLIEPLNTRVNHKGYYLESSTEALDIVQQVDHPNVGMLFDIYHQQVSEGDILTHIHEALPYIGHMHCAGVPGRGSLTESELDYAYVAKTIEQMGYRGYLGLELFTEDPEAEVRRWCKY